MVKVSVMLRQKLVVDFVFFIYKKRKEKKEKKDTIEVSNIQF